MALINVINWATRHHGI